MDAGCGRPHRVAPTSKIYTTTKYFCHTKIIAVGNGLDRSAGTNIINIGDNPTTERSRPFPTYSIWGVRIILRKILRCAQDDRGGDQDDKRGAQDGMGARFIRTANSPRRGDPMWSPAPRALSPRSLPAPPCHPERSEGSCSGDHIGSPLRQNFIPPQMILAEQNKFAVGNGLDRSAGTNIINVGDKRTTERSRPFPTYSIWGVRIILRKILRWAQDDRRRGRDGNRGGARISREPRADWRLSRPQTPQRRGHADFRACRSPERP